VANAWNEGAWDELGFGGIESATITPTGFEVSGEVGTPAIRTVNNFAVTGVEATGEVGEELGIGNQVWGGSSWNHNLGWGGITVVSPEATGIEVTSNVGSVTIYSQNNVSVTGIEATGELGEEFPIGNRYWGGGVWGGTIGWGGITIADVDVTGVEAVGELGEEEVDAKATVTLTGISATGEIGTVDPDAKANVYITAVTATTALGEEEVEAKANVYPTGVEANGEIGTVATKTVNNYLVTGIRVNARVGNAQVDGQATATVTGVSGTGVIARPLVWGEIDTTQNPGWLQIAA